MACNPNITALPSCITGDTWPGFTYAVSASGTITADQLASARMFFVNQSTGAVGLQLTTGSGVTITDAAGWSFEVGAITSFPLAAGTWFWSIEATAADGTIKTRAAGTINVILDATH
jgi:hypothetical protein